MLSGKDSVHVIWGKVLGSKGKMKYVQVFWEGEYIFRKFNRSVCKDKQLAGAEKPDK